LALCSENALFSKPNCFVNKNLFRRIFFTKEKKVIFFCDRHPLFSYQVSPDQKVYLKKYLQAKTSETLRKMHFVQKKEVSKS